MLVLIVEPGKAPRTAEIQPGLAALQEVVGGPVQVLYPFEDPVALVCHEEGKLLGLPANRGLRDEAGQLYDIVCGTFFLCGAPPDSEHLEGLTGEQAERYRQRFRSPELFLRVGGRLLCLPLEE